MNRSVIALLLISVLHGSGLSGYGQPSESAPPPSERASEAESAESMRELLDRRLSRSDRERAALEEAVNMLDQGDSPAAVREFLRERIGDDIRARAGQFRDRPAGDQRQQPPVRRGQRPNNNNVDRGGPDARGPERGRPRPDDPPPLPPERVMELLREANPPMFERLSRLRERNPEEFRSVIRRFAPRLAEFDRESRTRPEAWRQRVRMFQIEREGRALARAVAEKGADGDPEAINQLRTLLSEQFDLRLKMREQEVAELTERIATIRSQIEDAATERDAMVAQRTREMVRDAREGARSPSGLDEAAPAGRRGSPSRDSRPRERSRPQR